MAATQTGVAVVYGTSGITYTAGIVSATTKGSQQSVGFARDSEKAYLKDESGEDIGVVNFNLSKRLTITVIPYNAATPPDISDAGTSLDAWTPAPGLKVTVADSAGALIDGDYLVVSARQNRTNTGQATVDLELEARDANNITTATQA